MIRVSLKGLAARPVRAVLTALAIVLGVAMVSGSFVVTDTITQGVRHDLHELVRAHGRRRQQEVARRLLEQRQRHGLAERCS